MTLDEFQAAAYAAVLAGRPNDLAAALTVPYQTTPLPQRLRPTGLVAAPELEAMAAFVRQAPPGRETVVDTMQDRFYAAHADRLTPDFTRRQHVSRIADPVVDRPAGTRQRVVTPWYAVDVADLRGEHVAWFLSLGHDVYAQVLRAIVDAPRDDWAITVPQLWVTYHGFWLDGFAYADLVRSPAAGGEG